MVIYKVIRVLHGKMNINMIIMNSYFYVDRNTKMLTARSDNGVTA